MKNYVDYLTLFRFLLIGNIVLYVLTRLDCCSSIVLSSSSLTISDVVSSTAFLFWSSSLELYQWLKVLFIQSLFAGTAPLLSSMIDVRGVAPVSVSWQLTCARARLTWSRRGARCHLIGHQPGAALSCVSRSCDVELVIKRNKHHCWPNPWFWWLVLR